MNESTDLLEASVLGAAMISPRAARTVLEALRGGDFYQPKHELIFEALAWLASNDDPTDVVAVVDELLGRGDLDRAGGAEYVHGLTSAVSTPENVGYYAERVREHAARRALAGIGHGLLEVDDPAAAIARTIESLLELRDRTAVGVAEAEARWLGDVLNVPESEDAYDWVVPGLLERMDRLMLSAGEGVGKSTFLRQIAVLSAAGVHPFKFSQMPPLRVLVVDAENSERQWRRASRSLAGSAETFGARSPLRHLALHCVPVMDLTKVRDLGKVHRWMDQAKPDLVVLGPLYRMAKGSLNSDDEVAPVLDALDTIRERDVAMLIEVHAGHARGETGQRELRPRGSSALLGWPEFGFGLRRNKEFQGRQTFSLVRWRGDRDRRDWPVEFTQGQMWPWEPRAW